MKKQILPVLILILVSTACDPSKIYEKHLDNERIIWSRFDVKTFSVEITDIKASYDFYIAVRHHTEVPLKELDIRLVIFTPDGETRITEETVRVRDDNGKPLGDGMGDLWDLEQLIRKDFYFNTPGTCRVEISSAMSQADLPGIMQVGLIIRK